MLADLLLEILYMKPIYAICIISTTVPCISAVTFLSVSWRKCRNSTGWGSGNRWLFLQRSYLCCRVETLLCVLLLWTQVPRRCIHTSTLTVRTGILAKETVCRHRTSLRVQSYSGGRWAESVWERPLCGVHYAKHQRKTYCWRLCTDDRWATSAAFCVRLRQTDCPAEASRCLSEICIQKCRPHILLSIRKAVPATFLHIFAPTEPLYL